MNRKKLILSLAALLLALAAHVNVGWHVSLNGSRLEGCFSSGCIRRAELTARLAAEEILPGKALLPSLERRLHLSLKAPSEDISLLSHAMLINTPGLCLNDFVLVNGVNIGCVEDGERLMDELRSFVLRQMPNAAVDGSFSGEISLDPRYTRSGRSTDYGDMVLLVSGMAPVMYTDAEGKMA